MSALHHAVLWGSHFWLRFVGPAGIAAGRADDLSNHAARFLLRRTGGARKSSADREVCPTLGMQADRDP